MPDASWSVRVDQTGPSGSIVYREGPHTLHVGWEFGGTPDVIAILTFPEPRTWSDVVPWAADRRIPLMERIACEVVRQKAPGSVVDLHPASNAVYIRPGS